MVDCSCCSYLAAAIACTRSAVLLIEGLVRCRPPSVACRHRGKELEISALQPLVGHKNILLKFAADAP